MAKSTAAAKRGDSLSDQGDSLSDQGDSLSTTSAVPAVAIAETETWPIERLRPYDQNARKHSPKQIEQLRRSFRKFGQVWPLLVREDGTIISGHGRLEAVRAEGLATVRVIVARGWSEERCREFGLIDNKLALNSEWDDDRLAAELADLRAFGLDLKDTGFSERELSKLLLGEGEKQSTEPQLAGLSYSIVVRCADESHQTELLEKLEKEGLTCEALIS